MDIVIITGRPGSGKTSQAYEFIQKNLNKRILYWCLEGGIAPYMKEKFLDVHSSSMVSVLMSRLLEDFFLKLKSETFDIVVIDYIELLNNDADFISQIKNVQTLYVLSQERKDGTHFYYPRAKVLKLPNVINS